MCLVSKSTNIAYGIGNCPEYSLFCTLKKRKYEEDPTAMDIDLKQFEERGVVKVNSNKKELTLTLILREGNRNIKKVEIECVDQLQAMFFLSHLEDVTEKGCNKPCCELPCCVLNKLNVAILS